MQRRKALLTLAAFLFAAAFSLVMATFVGGALESRSERHSLRALNAAGFDWVEVSADGLLVTLTGTAPTEAIRFRAAKVVADTVGASRVIDQIEVTPARALTAPHFSLELLRNDDGVSIIGLVPTAWEGEAFVTAADSLSEQDLTNMIETADFPPPEGWDPAIAFGFEALKTLPRSKISISATQVKITAIADSPDQKAGFERALNRVRPRGLNVVTEISAPRPVITPFTLRFVIEDGKARFDACAADTERARARILTAARQAGAEDNPSCVIGLGTPSPSWADAAVQSIGALAKLGAGSVTISDVDLTLIADSTVLQSEFDRVVGELTTALPDVFSLKATLTPREQASTGPAQFTGILAADGKLQLRGRLADDRMKTVVEAYARARFGAENVYIATRQEDTLPQGWGLRVLAGLAALSELNSGGLLVEPDLVAVKGETGSQGARAEISRLLSNRLGQGAEFRVDVTYNERLDPTRGLPSAHDCLKFAENILGARQIKFAPGSKQLEGDSLKIVEDMAAALKDCREVQLEIGGHTDSQGRAESNLALSQERADAVLEKLAELGTDVSEMSARGYGASQPLADNGTEAGRDANRRIAVKLLNEIETRPSLRDLLRELEQEDDGEALPDAITGDETDDLIPEGEEPMGEAGDLEVGSDGEVTPAEEEEPASPAETSVDAEPAPAPEETAQEPADTAPETAPEAVDDGLWTPHPEVENLRPRPRQ
ncbi:OmpA family protein [Falsigemmobacter faecalis]|uniref:BON domain-containing protein n=1 Tax=Falsigemmobacter faecalis TaxID=2488730 RepID=A0A3P3DYP5_9RHOB|nr:OmpA family protein [Falsigemmobacter faecalis]RRH78562.1 BON domain-containing protein [Falsigemmobacter faecalis]